MSWEDDVVREIIVEDVYRLGQVDFSTGAVVDAGANVGVFARRVRQLGARDVVCIEPHPRHFEALAAAFMGVPEVRLVRAAVGKPGRGRMAGDDGSAVLIEGDEVDVLPLEAVMPPGEIALLKLDVEGGEFDAIAGCSHEALARCRRIAIETHAAVPGRLGALVERLTETHHVETLGAASRGGYIYALRY